MSLFGNAQPAVAGNTGRADGVYAVIHCRASGSGLSRLAHVTGHKKPAQGGILAPGSDRLITTE